MDKKYKLQGRLSFRGLDIAVENRAGSIRRGKDWETRMFYPYGYIRGTMGVDGDPVDVYVGKDRESDKVFIIHQKNPETGRYDEDKVMLGFETLITARDGYLAHYDSHKFLGEITELSFEEFKKKVLATKEKPKMIKSIGRLLKAFGQQMGMFEAPTAGGPSLEGETRMKDGKTYQVKRSKKNPNVKRVFRINKPEPEQKMKQPEGGLSLFDKPVSIGKPKEAKKDKQQVSSPAPEPKAKPEGKVEKKEEKIPDLFSQAEDEPKEPTTKKPDKSGLDQFGVGHLDKQVRKKRIEINRKVRELLASKKDEEMTDDDIKLLAQYSGTGGTDIVSLNEYYTPDYVAKFQWDMLKKLGFTNGSVLEPSCGTGVFIHTAPEEALVTGIEYDETSSRIAGILFKDHDIHGMSFEKYNANEFDREFQAAIGNVPFGVRGVSAGEDPEKINVPTHEQYFLDRIVDNLEEGGVASIIVPTGIMDNQINPYRLELNKKAEFLGAIRMPTGVFAKANAVVTTDIVFFRKRPQEVIDRLSELEGNELKKLYDAQILDADFVAGEFFSKNPEYALGEDATGQFGQKIKKGNITEADLNKAGELIKDFEEDYSVLGDLGIAIKDKRELHVGDIMVKNGRTYRLNENHRWERLSEEQAQQTVLPKELQDLFGIKTYAELDELQRDRSRHFELTREQLKELDSDYNELDKYLDKNLNKNEYLKQAVILGLAIREFQKGLQDGSIWGSDAQLEAQRLAIWLDDFKEKYGNPVLDKAILKNLGKSEKNPLLYLAGSFDGEGNLSRIFDDPLSFYNVYKTKAGVGKMDIEDAGSITSYYFENSIPATLEIIKQTYRGELSENELHKAILNDETIYIDENGNYAPINEVCMGEVYSKLDYWENRVKENKEKLKTDISDFEKEILVLENKKLDEQIFELRRRAGTKNIEDLPVSIGDAGRFYSMKLLNEYLEERIPNHYAGPIVIDPHTKLFTFEHSVLAEIYNLFASKGSNDKEDTKELKELMKSRFGSEQNPFIMLVMNKLNNIPSQLRGDKRERIDEELQSIAAGIKTYLSGSNEAEAIADAYNRAYNNYIQKTYDASPIEGIEKYDYEKVVTVTPDGREITARDKAGDHTWATVRRMYDQQKGMIAHGVGLGKAQPLDALILTPNGYVKMGDVFVGQEIINSKGEISQITNIYPQGELDAYEVMFNDGSKVVCNDEHLWAVRTFGQQRKNAPFQVKTLKEIMPKLIMKGKQRRYNYRIPMIDPIQFSNKKTLLDAYLLGLLLGDGSITNEVAIIIGEKDRDIIDYCKEIAPKYGTELIVNPERKTHYKFVRINPKTENKVRSSLAHYKLLGGNAETKFIPKEYLLNDIETRLSVLQGLIDTDGYLGKDGVIQYTTVSNQLKEDVKFIVHSLGGTAIEHWKQGKYFNGKEYVICKIAYTLNISLPTQFICLRNQRKLKRFKPRKLYPPNRLIKSVKHIGKAEMQCISVDSEDHLYVTNDMVLTHNTLQGILLTLLAKQTGRAKKPLIVTPKSILINWAAEIEKWTKNVNFMMVGYHKKDESKGWTTDNIKEDTTEQKKLKLMQVASGDYDMVLMTRDFFTSIDFSVQTKENMIDELTDKFYPGDEDKNKKIKKKKEGMRQNLTKIFMKGIEKDKHGKYIGKADDIYFENLGFDMIMRDESHDVKNLLVPMEMEVAGLNASDARRSYQHYFASKIIRNKTDEKGVYSLTATPISNSPLEVFNMMLPFAEKELEKMNVNTMDDFIRRFAEISIVPTTDADGRVKMKNKFTAWQAPDELRNAFFRFVDYKTKDDVESVKANIKFPNEKPNNVFSEMNEGQRELMKHCRQRLWTIKYSKPGKDGSARELDKEKLQEAVKESLISQEEHDAVVNYYENEYLVKFANINGVRNPDDPPFDDTYFSVQSDMIKITGDLEWYSETSSEYSTKVDPAFVTQHAELPKFDQIIDNVSTLHTQGKKQLLFAINTRLHNKIKDKLIASGVPAEEIIIVNGKTMKNSAKRKEVSDDYNAGKYKVVIGNYATMGEGLNFNNMTSDIHHIQPAWNYLQIEQGNGRGIRQGNPLDEVNTHYYNSKGSIDAFMNQKIKEKGKMVDQFMRGEQSTWDDETQLQAEQMLIELSDNPALAEKLYAQQNKKLQEAIAQKERSSNFRRFDQLYDMKNRLSKMEDKESKRYLALQEEVEKTMNQLNNSENFEHKQYLTLDKKPIVLPGSNVVIPVGSVIKYGFNDQEFAIVDNYSPSTGNVTITEWSAGGTKTKKMAIKLFASQYGETIEKRDFDTEEMFNKLISDEENKMDDYKVIYKLPKDQLQKHKKQLIKNLREGSYGYLFYRDSENNLKAGRAYDVIDELDEQGGRLVFPQEDDEAINYLHKTVANYNNRGYNEEYWASKEIASKLYGEKYEKVLERLVKQKKGETVVEEEPEFEEAA